MEEEKEFYINCPHCNDIIIIEKLNCRIFRHGIYKDSNKQINPHASKDECEQLIKNNEIYGCGKPFMIETHNNIHKVIVCEYI
jgi:DNA-directed RNA polymerase subunit RPC12/RpoP